MGCDAQLAGTHIIRGGNVQGNCSRANFPVGTFVRYCLEEVSRSLIPVKDYRSLRATDMICAMQTAFVQP